MSNRNVIPGRIADALRHFPPFSMLAAPDVEELAQRAAVVVKAGGDIVWKQGDRPGDELLFLAQGRVEYNWEENGRIEMVDIRDIGDLLGLTALYEGLPFRVTANAAEDCLFYSLPWGQVRPLIEASDPARNYTRRHLFWATRVGGAVSLAEPEPTFGGRAKNILQAHLDGARSIEPRPVERLMTCSIDQSVREAAALMSSKRVPSVLVVDESRRPIGIVTSSNLVKAVIVDGMDTSLPVSGVMASPVITVSATSSATAAILLMLRHRIGQVCVTEDGTTNTPALDVCSHKDLLAYSGHHPAGLLREIRQTKSPARFRELCDDAESIAKSYLETGVSGILVGQICAELYDELVERFIGIAQAELAEAKEHAPKAKWAWMSVGSDGRREQILRTDMDNAIVFESSDDEEIDERVRSYLLLLANKVVDRMVDCGFSRCQGGVMACNPRWCRTTKEWIAELGTADAFVDPEKMLRAMILYDMRRVAGDKTLFEGARNQLFDTASKNRLLLKRMAELIVATPPPLNFFGKFMVERKGARQGEFDIKARALSPLRDAARLYALAGQLTRRYSTGGRWEDIRRSSPRLAELAGLARESYDFLLRLRNVTGLRRGDSGRFIQPTALTKLEKAQLSNAFDVLRLIQQSLRHEYAIDGRG